MWHKVHPVWFRVWVTRSWWSEWFAVNDWQAKSFFLLDIQLRRYIEKYYDKAWLAKIVVRQTKSDVEVILFTSKIAAITGKDNVVIDKLQSKIKKKFWISVVLTPKLLKTPELSAKIMAEFMVSQIENRLPFRKVAKNTMQKIMEKNPLWVKIKVSWRLWWVDISRSETYSEWRIPLQTLRVDIDYCETAAMTKYGIIGIKVWIAKSELFAKTKQLSKKEIVL